MVNDANSATVMSTGGEGANARRPLSYGADNKRRRDAGEGRETAPCRAVSGYSSARFWRYGIGLACRGHAVGQQVVCGQDASSDYVLEQACISSAQERGACRDEARLPEYHADLCVRGEQRQPVPCDGLH